MPIPQIFNAEIEMVKPLKKVYMKIKKTRLFNWFRSSRLNPFHKKLPLYKTETLQEAFDLARQKGQSQILYKDKKAKRNVRFLVEQHPKPGQDVNENIRDEYNKYHRILRSRSGDISDRIPRNEKGEFDLFAEDPIIIAINPFEGPSLVGHAGIQFRDKVVNRVLPSVHTDPLFQKYDKFSEYYFIYPSQIGINPKKLEHVMEKHFILNGRKKYNPVTNNCVKNVAQVLEKVGVKDLDFFGIDKIGLTLPTPGNTPYHFGLKDWCLKHGFHALHEEVAAYESKINFGDIAKRRKQNDQIRERFKTLRYHVNKDKLR